MNSKFMKNPRTLAMLNKCSGQSAQNRSDFPLQQDRVNDSLQERVNNWLDDVVQTNNEYEVKDEDAGSDMSRPDESRSTDFTQMQPLTLAPAAITETKDFPSTKDDVSKSVLILDTVTQTENLPFVDSSQETHLLQLHGDEFVDVDLSNTIFIELLPQNNYQIQSDNITTSIENVELQSVTETTAQVPEADDTQMPSVDVEAITKAQIDNMNMENGSSDEDRVRKRSEKRERKRSAKSGKRTEINSKKARMKHPLLPATECKKRCRNECKVKISEECRAIIHEKFWKLDAEGRKTYLLHMCHRAPIRSRLVGQKHVKDCTFKYHLKDSKYSSNKFARSASSYERRYKDKTTSFNARKSSIILEKFKDLLNLETAIFKYKK